MKRVIDIDVEYKYNAERAIKYFFKRHPEIAYWEETLEWMNKNGVHHVITIEDGKPSDNWTFSIWLDKLDDNLTYIAVIERE